jgi:hypothetical protein
VSSKGGGSGSPDRHGRSHAAAANADAAGAGATAEEPWKIELQNRLSELHHRKLAHVAEEAAADKQTIQQIKSLELNRQVPPSSIDEQYINSVIDNLSSLYIDINESYFEE